MKKLLSVILSIIMLIPTTIAFADETSVPTSNGTITVGVNAEFAPFEYYNEDGELTGFDIDLMNYLAEKLRYDIEYRNKPFDALFLSVMSGETDCAISAITITEERKKNLYYTTPYIASVNNGSYENYGIAVGNDELCEQLNSALAIAKADGTVEKLLNKYELNKDGNYSVVYVNTEPHQPKTSATSIPGSDWAVDIIGKARKLNIVNSGGNYNYPGAITREEFCELVYNLVILVNQDIKSFIPDSFTDTKNEKVLRLNSMGIINGKTATEFAPDDYLTREEAATIIIRMINTVMPMPATEMWFEYDDISEISEWASDSIQTISNLGFMNGVGNNRFAPKDTCTTEQAVATLVRVYASSGVSKSDDMTFADRLKAQMPTDTNYMFSPLSIKMAFAMAANGADGNTKTEILNALDIDNLDEYNEYAKKLIEGYQKADILKLDIANALWLNETNTTQKFSESYQNTLKSFYDAEVNGSTRDKIAGEINSWVKEKTNDKIDSIITDELAQDERFIMALLNAVYFKAAWQNEFDEDATKKDIFTDRNGNEKQTDFMNETAYYGYYNDNGIEVLALPYKNRVYDETAEEMISYDFDVSMYLIRGDYSENTLSSLIENNSLANRRIKLSVPKFESEFDTSLIDVMNNLGVVDAFEDKKADFKKMFDKGNMYLMAALHKTYIKVDERGTEAAAVTAFAGGATSAPPEPLIVKFDTPFTYVIRDDANGEILFMGEYAFAE